MLFVIKETQDNFLKINSKWIKIDFLKLQENLKGNEIFPRQISREYNLPQNKRCMKLIIMKLLLKQMNKKSSSKILLNIFNIIWLVEFCLQYSVYLFVYLGTHGEDKHCDMESVNLKELQKSYWDCTGFTLRGL